MINIITRRLPDVCADGPTKVVRNVMKGLDRLGYPYVVNRDVRSTRRLWVANESVPLQYLPRERPFTVAGPSIWVLPEDIRERIDWNRMVYVQPSLWTCRLWEFYGFSKCPMVIWPVGLDLDDYSPAVRGSVSRKGNTRWSRLELTRNSGASASDARRSGLESRDRAWLGKRRKSDLGSSSSPKR